MATKTEFISVLINMKSHFQSIRNQRSWRGFRDVIRYLIGQPIQEQKSDSVKAHFISFYYKRRLRNIKKIIDEHRELFEENIELERLNSFMNNVEHKLNSKNPDLFEYYDDEDDGIEQFFHFLNTNFEEDIKRYEDDCKRKIKKEQQLIKKASKINPDQAKFDF